MIILGVLANETWIVVMWKWTTNTVASFLSVSCMGGSRDNTKQRGFMLNRTWGSFCVYLNGLVRFM